MLFEVGGGGGGGEQEVAGSNNDASTSAGPTQLDLTSSLAARASFGGVGSAHLGWRGPRVPADATLDVGEVPLP